MQAVSLKAGKKTILIGNRCLTIKTKKEMKKNLFMVAAVALMALVSCNKEEINNGVQEPASDIVFVAEFEQEADTKIALGEKVDGVRKTTWVAGDMIKINGTEFSAKEAGEVTEFTTATSFTEATTYRAVYPASSYISTAAVDIPAAQNGTFASASIAVAESSTTSLKFNNLVTILKFRVPVNCSKVTFESTASIAGRITVKYTDGVMTPDYSGVTQPSKTINVTGTFVPDTDYYVAVKPGTHTFTVKIDDEVSKASTKAVTVERSKILNMGVLPEPVVAENAVLRINNKNGWGDLKITIKQGSTTLVNAKPMVNEGDNIFAYSIDPQYIGKEVTYFIGHSWYTTSTKTTTLKADSEATAITLNTIYLQPGTWDQNSATFGAWIWGTGVADTMLTGKKVSNDFYEFEIPADGYKNVIFLRCDKNNTTADWSRKWNQTENLTLKHMCFCVHSWTQSDLTDARWF